jgi:hypothetical protein
MPNYEREFLDQRTNYLNAHHEERKLLAAIILALTLPLIFRDLCYNRCSNL